MQLMVHHELREDAVVVRVEGEVDITVADEFSSHLKVGLDTALAHQGRPLIIDLQTVAFFGSAGLTAVLACHNEGVSNGIAVGLVATNAVVVRVIKLTGLDDTLALYPTVDAALHPPPHREKPA